MRTTLKLLCARGAAVKEELTIEAQKVFDLCNDPNVPEEEKVRVKKELDAMIKKLEERAETSKRIRGEKA